MRNDIRGIIAGLVAVVAIVTGGVVAAGGDAATGERLIALAGVSVGYAVGLYSEPHANDSSE